MTRSTPNRARRRERDSLDSRAAADAAEGIRQGLEDVKKGRVRPAEEFFKEFEAKHGLSSED